MAMSTMGYPNAAKLVAFAQAQQRGTWAPHCEDAWYIGPAFDHYRCYTIWTWETRWERERDTLSWFPHQLRVASPSAIDRIAAGVHDIAAAHNHSTSGSPLSPLDTSQVSALNDLLILLTATLSDENEGNPFISTGDVAPPAAPCLKVEIKSQGDTDDTGDTLTYRTATKRKSRQRPAVSAVPIM